MAGKTIKELNAAINDGSMTVEQVRAILSERAKRDAGTGRRAQAWLDAHPASKPRKRTSKPAPKPEPTQAQKDARKAFSDALASEGLSAAYRAYKRTMQAA